MSDKSSRKANPELIKALTTVLADTTVAYYKTHGFHWNVESPTFYGLHIMFEKFYETLWESMDEIAERIRALGEKTPPRLSELLTYASLQETNNVPPANMMVQLLRDDYRKLAKTILDTGILAASQGDAVTENMMAEKATFLEKAAWMLDSSLKS